MIVSHQHRWDVTEDAFNVFRWKMLVLSLSRRCSRLSSGDSGFGPYGVFGAEADEAALGQSVTLHSGVEEYHQISWWLEKSNIARCRVNTPETRSCEITDEGLRDRLKTDNQTGSLSIINISTGLAGLYKLQIIDKAFKESYKDFSVTVSAPLSVPIIVPEQSSCQKCLKQCSAVNVTLSWYKGNSSFSSISVSDLSSGVSVLLKGNDQDFSIYSCVMNDSISSQTKQLNITELCQPCPEADLYQALISVLVIAAALGVAGAVAAVIYCYCKKCTRRYGVDCRYDVKRETVSMINSRSDEESPAGIDEELQPNSDTCVNIH